MMENAQITVTIYGGFDGGLVVYESVDGESRLVFGGDHEAATKYLSGRMVGLLGAAEPGPVATYTKPRAVNPAVLREHLKTEIISG